MRILMLLYNLVGKGTYWRALYLAQGLAKRGHDVTMICSSTQRSLRFKNREHPQPEIKILTSPNILGGAFASGWDPFTTTARLGWSLQKNTFDIVHGFESRPTVIFPALYWQRIRGVPLVLDWCDLFGEGGSVEERPNRLLRTILRPVETFFENHFRSWADGTTVINAFLQQRAIELGVDRETIALLSNGSNVDDLALIPQKTARKVLGWPEDLLIIGYIGAMFHKDAALMAQTFDRIYKIEPRARLLLVGYCNIAIKELVTCPNAVLQTGPINYDKINVHLAACDVCWLPLVDSNANRGRYPLKINDYMAVGRPVVATAVGDVANLISQGEFGLLAADNPSDLAQQVLKLLQNPTLGEKMGQRARYIAEAKFTWDRIAGQLEQFYQTVMEKKRWN